MVTTDHSQPPAKPPMDPQTFRVVLVGALILVTLIGIDSALELTGHGGSPVATLLTKLLTAVVGVVTAYQAGRSPGPGQAEMGHRLAALARAGEMNQAANQVRRPGPPPVPKSGS